MRSITAPDRHRDTSRKGAVARAWVQGSSQRWRQTSCQSDKMVSTYRRAYNEAQAQAERDEQLGVHRDKWWIRSQAVNAANDAFTQHARETEDHWL